MAATLRTTQDIGEQQRYIYCYIQKRETPPYASNAARSVSAGLITIAAGAQESAKKTTLDKLVDLSTDPKGDLEGWVRDALALCKTEERVAVVIFLLLLATCFVLNLFLVMLNAPIFGLAAATAGLMSASIYCKLRHAPLCANAIDSNAFQLMKRFHQDIFEKPDAYRQQEFFSAHIFSTLNKCNQLPPFSQMFSVK